MKKALSVLIVLLFFSSCVTTRYVPTEVEKIRYISTMQYDSIYVSDSVSSLILHDTVYLYKEKTYNRYINKHDTVFIRDSIPYIQEVTVTKEIEVNKLKWYQRSLMHSGIIFIGFIIILIIKLIKKIF